MLLFSLSELADNLPAASSCFILVDENTRTHCLPILLDAVPLLRAATILLAPVGDAAKSFDVASALCQTLLDAHADRHALLINLGGGCLSDIGGFVAACFKRGIAYVNVPTSLLAMVDAAVGGKTAINLSRVKNVVGFFYPPSVVCIYTPFIHSLPSHEVSNGSFELVKTALLCGRSAPFTLHTDNDFHSAIVEAARFKSDVCLADPLDKGIRKMLNLGHTFGHAIESFFATTARPLPHGFAVGLGLWCELYLSVHKLGLSPDLLYDYQRWLLAIATIPHFTLRDAEVLLDFMRNDKKNDNGLILCVLLSSPGAPVIDVPVSDDEVRDTFLGLSQLT